LALRLPLLESFNPKIVLELVSMPQAVNLTRKEADIFLSFFKPSVSGLTSEQVGSFSLFLYCSRSYIEQHGLPLHRDDLPAQYFIAYIEDLLANDAVRWLDEAVKNPDVRFYSNSIIAQCSAALSGTGIAMLPTFVAAGIPGLVRILEREVTVERKVWVSVRTE